MLLPFELLEHIISFVNDQENLSSLCLSSCACNTAAARRLYHAPRPSSFLSFVKLCRTLHRRPDLARRVRQLDLAACGYSTTSATRKLFKAPAARLVFRAVRSLPNLQRLNFPVRSYLWDPLLLGLSLPSSVTALELDLHCEGLYHRVVFLQELPELRELSFREWQRTVDWDCLMTIHRFSRAILPKLEKLTAPLSVANALVPNRPITTLVVDGTIRSSYIQHAAPLWAYSAGPLRFLSLEIAHLRESDLQMICLHVPTLYGLELNSQTTEGGQVMKYLTTPSTLKALESVLRLARLSLRTDIFRDLVQEDYLPSVLTLGQACPSLKDVILDGKSGEGLSVYANVHYRKEPGKDRLIDYWLTEKRFVSRW